MKELVLITARTFKPGQLVASEIAARVNTVWVADDPDAATLLDVATFCVSRVAYEFFSPAISFEVEVLPAPAFVYPGWKSYIDMCLTECGCASLQSFFEGDAWKHWKPLIERKLVELPSASAVSFYAVYDVTVTVQRDEEDSKDTSLDIEFVGELDFETLGVHRD